MKYQSSLIPLVIGMLEQPSKLRISSMRLLAILILLTVLPQSASAGAADNSADQCFKRAEKFEKEANRYANDVRDPRKWFALALENYLCAANKGHVVAKWRAVSLSASGQVAALPKEVEDRLLWEAAEAGLPEAQIAMYYSHCDNVDTKNVCKNPVESEKWLLRAARAGSAWATYLLGYFYEGKGGEEKTHTDKSLACYRLAEQRYRSDMKDKRGEDLRQLKSELETVGWGIKRVINHLKHSTDAVSCY